MMTTGLLLVQYTSNNSVRAGANYYSHAEEMKTARPDPRATPFFFMKPPTTTITGPVTSVPLPRGEAPDYDWEGELAIVIGRPGQHIAPEDAAAYVAPG
jgi:2-keto-4-pentenoate hydratase/2-oxohepta-3-ene-1,7-dioic acid hydratase in catechol pathway